jgi:hypothetical protein
MSTGNAGDYMMKSSVAAMEPTANGALAAAPFAPPVADSQSQNMVNNINVNVGMAAPAMPSIQFNAAKTGPNFFVRAIWFLTVGFWLSGFFIAIGYLLVATLFLMPIGLWFLNRVPQAQTLRARTREFTTEMRGNTLVFTEGRRKQHPWYLRLLYLPVGLIAGFFWLALAWLVSLTIVGLPVSIMMIDRAPTVITLQKN